MPDTFATRTLRELMRVVFLRLGRIVLFVLVAAGVTWWACTRATPIYRSTVTLMYKQPSAKSPTFKESVERPLEVFVKAQQQIVMSDLVLARTKVIASDPALRKAWADLRSRYDDVRRRRSLPSDPYDPARTRELVAIQAEIDEFLGRTTPGGGGSTVGDRVKKFLDSQQRELSDFRDGIKFRTPGGEQVAMTESFQISVDQPAPADQKDSHLNAMHAADILADMYMVRFRELQSNLAGAADEFMKRVVDEHVKVIRSAENRLNEFIQNELDSPGDVAILEQLLKSGTEHGYQIIATRGREAYLRLTDDLAKARSVRDQLKAALPKQCFEPDGIGRLSDDEVARAVAVVPPEVSEANIIINRMTARLIQVQSKVTSLATVYTPESQAMREAMQELRETRRNLLTELAAHARGIEVTIKAYEQRLAENDSNLKNVESRLDKINRKLTEYQRLKNDVLVAQKQHQDIQQEQVDAFVAAEQARSAITIEKLDNASQPDPSRPAQPLVWLYTGIAAGVGLLLAVSMAFLADHYDHSIRTIDEAERYLGVPVLGSVSRQGRTILPRA